MIDEEKERLWDLVERWRKEQDNFRAMGKRIEGHYADALSRAIIDLETIIGRRPFPAAPVNVEIKTTLLASVSDFGMLWDAKPETFVDVGAVLPDGKMLFDKFEVEILECEMPSRALTGRSVSVRVESVDRNLVAKVRVLSRWSNPS